MAVHENPPSSLSHPPYSLLLLFNSLVRLFLVTLPPSCEGCMHMRTHTHPRINPKISEMLDFLKIRPLFTDQLEEIDLFMIFILSVNMVFVNDFLQNFICFSIHVLHVVLLSIYS